MLFIQKNHHKHNQANDGLGKRDSLYQQVAKLTINSDDSALEEHARCIIQAISGNEVMQAKTLKSTLDKKDITLFHKEHHTLVHLSDQQAVCLKLLA